MSKDFKKILKHHAKSFYFAGLLLDKATLNNSAVLYAFCRQLDDAADLGLNSKKRVDIIVEDYRSVVSKNNVNIAFKELQNKFNLDQIFKKGPFFRGLFFIQNKIFPQIQTALII